MQGILWGTLPVAFSILAILVVLLPEKRNRLVPVADLPYPREDLAARGILS